MRFVALALLLLGLSLVADAAAFAGRHTQSALTALDHETRDVRHSIDDWLGRR
jgi:hypothetical protein